MVPFAGAAWRVRARSAPTGHRRKPASLEPMANVSSDQPEVARARQPEGRAPRGPAVDTRPAAKLAPQAGVTFSRSGLSGVSVMPVTGSGGGSPTVSNRAARTSVAMITVASIMANEAPTHMRGPAPNGMNA